MRCDFESDLVQARHRRARELAAAAPDGDLSAQDSAWLQWHLALCADCRAVAEEYQSIHEQMRSLEAPPVPRDLWARTSAALDMVDTRAGRMAGARTANRMPSRTLVGSAIAVVAVVILAGASLLAQPPLGGRSGSSSAGIVAAGTPTPAAASPAPRAPIAVVDGTSYWIASSGGVYQIRGSSADCTASNGSCTVSGGAGQTLGSISSDSQVSAVLAPDARQAAVWTADKVAIVPLAATPQTVSFDLLTPRPTVVPTPSPSTTEATATTSVGPSPSLAGTPTPAPSPSPTAGPSAAPSATAAPTPGASASAGPVTSTAVAILDGYEVVGPAPQFSPDGDLVAFSARPVDHSTGPDVFVWRTGDARAEAITGRHSDTFAGWFGRTVMINEISGGSGATGPMTMSAYFYDPAARQALEVDRPMLLAGVDASGTFVIYWSGTLEFDTASGLWQPGSGDLYFDRMANLGLGPARLDQAPVASASAPVPSTTIEAPSPSPLPSSGPAILASPSAGVSVSPSSSAQVNAPSPSPSAGTEPQQLAVAAAPGSVWRWSVKWDASGSNVAVWVADPGSEQIGRLSLFALDRTNGVLSPTLAAGTVLATISFDDGRLVYTSALDGTTYLKTVPPAPPVPSPSPTTSAPVVEPEHSGGPGPGSSPTVEPASSVQPGS